MLLSFSESDGIWAKGNIHTHTSCSDGDSPPDAVAKWYKDHGYQFIAFTDHNKLTASTGSDENFIVLQGEELTTHLPDTQIHVNALDISSPLPPAPGDLGRLGVVQRNIDTILAVGGIPIINHPESYNGLNSRELLNTSRFKLIEILNASAIRNSRDDPQNPPAEKYWDDLLSAGRTIYAVASDDTHHMKDWGCGFDNPGFGWIVAHVTKLTEVDILNSIGTGRFYASNGVELLSILFDGETISISAKSQQNLTYRVQFIGLCGIILQDTTGSEAVYKLTRRREEAYIRAKIISNTGSAAWTQPVFPFLIPRHLLTGICIYY